MVSGVQEDDIPKNIPPYTPMSSLGHELGILFGFLAACFIVMGLYVMLWRSMERREALREKVRREQFAARLHSSRGAGPEKPHEVRRAELPGHTTSGFGELASNITMSAGSGARRNRANGWVELDILETPKR
ncbi:hypothetical protein BDV25DRAFT_143798 [Aspergillus avenaceus]|uniref:Uncharacterized protein n=1 Tax=Aspergillus avenaceus TaxID=36643 RepID=A0A5N6TJT9_ASPAV|nr:hypothetical protein BDV25DRAFT_143798 [Aspergillus avenaceus]